METGFVNAGTSLTNQVYLHTPWACLLQIFFSFPIPNQLTCIHIYTYRTSSLHLLTYTAARSSMARKWSRPVSKIYISPPHPPGSPRVEHNPFPLSFIHGLGTRESPLAWAAIFRIPSQPAIDIGKTINLRISSTNTSWRIETLDVPRPTGQPQVTEPINPQELRASCWRPDGSQSGRLVWSSSQHTPL